MPATLEQDVEAYAEHQRAGSARPRTVVARLSGVRILATFCAGGDPRTVTRDDLTRWLGNPEHAPWTRATYWCHARAWCLFLVETGRRTDDPAAKMKRPRVPRGVPRPLSNAQVATVLASAGRKARVYILLAAYAGLRVHEIAQLRGEDVDELSVRVVNGKGGHDRLIPTHPWIWAAAADMPRRGLWFPSYGASGHIKPDSVSTAIRRALTSVGIEGHAQLRHTFGTQGSQVVRRKPEGRSGAARARLAGLDGALHIGRRQRPACGGARPSRARGSPAAAPSRPPGGRPGPARERDLLAVAARACLDSTHLITDRKARP